MTLSLAPISHYADETIPVFARWFGSWQISLERRPLSVPELTRRYDHSAPEWSKTLDRLGFPDAYATMLRRVLCHEGSDVIAANTRVLDCGIGTGALSAALARVSPAPFSLDGIDISPPMLEHAGASLHASGVNATLRRGDVCRLPYNDDSFDIVMTAHVLEHIVDPSIALNEMVRVLKPGGLFIASLTRRSFLGMMIHLKWRTHPVAPWQAVRLLRDSGLQHVKQFSFEDTSVCRQFSVPCTGRKPHSHETETIDTKTTSRSQ